MTVAASSSASSSWTTLIVTVCFVSQFELVNVRDAGLAVTSVSSVASASSAAVTVTVWAVSQSLVVKVSVLEFRVRSVPAWPEMVTVTPAVGLTAQLHGVGGSVRLSLFDFQGALAQGYGGGLVGVDGDGYVPGGDGVAGGVGGRHGVRHRGRLVVGLIVLGGGHGHGLGGAPVDRGEGQGGR